MTSSRNREWLVERVALDEAPSDVELTASERDRLAELVADDESIRAAYPKASVAAEILRRDRTRRASASAHRSRTLNWLAPAVAVAAAFVLFLSIGTSPQPDPGREATRLKGAAIVVHRKTVDGADVMKSGDTAAAGDRIQLGFRLDRAAFGALVSIDGRGVVTFHLPSEVNAPAVQLEAGVAQLPYSYELDDAPAFERFVLVTSERSFSLDAVKQAAAKLAELSTVDAVRAPLDLPDGLGQLDFVLLKGDVR